MATIRPFPSKIFCAKLSVNDPSVWTHLQECTELRDSLVTVRTDKTFIGQVRPGQFNLISSRIGLGAFCTLEGRFTSSDLSGTIHIQVHKVFRILILIWLILPAGALTYGFWSQGPMIGLLQVLNVSVALLFLRFVVIELLFRWSVKNGLKALTTVLRLVDVKEVK
jgi:hypothetical protein